MVSIRLTPPPPLVSNGQLSAYPPSPLRQQWSAFAIPPPPPPAADVICEQPLTKENLINLPTGADFLVKVVTKNYKCLPHLFTKEKLMNL